MGDHSKSSTAVDHLLALKVMRLTRPTLSVPLLVPSCDQKSDILRDALIKDVEQEGAALKGLEQLCVGQTLVLPQSFGNIYLGESFTSYVSLHNDSTETCGKVTLRCDLQTATQRIPLFPGPAATCSTTVPKEEFVPGGSVDIVLNHEVKELGAHILVCEVHYSTPNREKLSFRKFFKFQVMKPLDVKTKFYNAESDEVFLEAQVQNVTLGPLCLEKVCLEPSQLFQVSSLNSVARDFDDDKNDSDGFDSGDDDEEENKASVFGRVNCIQPQDSRQYLFCLTPRGDARRNHKLLKSVTNIGKLDIVWRTNLGDRGRLQTSQLQRLAPQHGEVRVAVEEAPAHVVTSAPFNIAARVFNNCDRTLDLELNLLPSSSSPDLSWSGVTATRLGLLEPGGCADLNLELVAELSGLHSVSGVRLTDTLLKRTYDFDDLCQVFACHNKEMVEELA